MADKSKSKTKKHMKTKTKNKVIIAIVITVLALLVFGYFANMTNLPAKVLPGAKIVQTVNGKQKTVKRISIVEMNYYFQTTYSQYTSYGLISSANDLDEVYNPTTGQTYRQMLWETAANTAQTQYMLYDAAKKAGFKPIAAEEYAENQVESIRSSLGYVNQLNGSNMTCDQYLQNLYGPGMTVQIYRGIMKRQATVDEYRLYVQQTTMMPDQATLQAKFDADPAAYTYCHFQAYFVKADIPDNATEEEKQKALEDAEKTAHLITDDCSNAVEFQTRVKVYCDDEFRQSFIEGNDPTSRSGYTRDQLKTVNEEFAEMCFNPDTKANTTMVFQDKDATGYYATMFEDTYLEEELTCAYRVIKLDDEVLRDISNTLEQKAPSHQKLHAEADGYVASVTTEEQFIELAKKHSVDTDSLLSGGYYSGIKESSFTPTMVEGEEKYADEDLALMAWLFDPARQKGDMIIIDCVASVNIYYYCDGMPAWMDSIRAQEVADRYQAWYKGVVSDESYSTIVNDGLIDFFT